MVACNRKYWRKPLTVDYHHQYACFQFHAGFNPHIGNEGVFYPSAPISLKFANLQIRWAEIFGDIVTDTLKFWKPLSSFEYLYPFHHDITGSEDEKSEKVIFSRVLLDYTTFSGVNLSCWGVDGSCEKWFVSLQKVVHHQLTAWIQYGGR